MKTRKRYLLAKVESVYGTLETMVAANAIITSGLERELYAGPTVSRENNRSALGARQRINTAPMVSQTFSVEMMGSGTLGTPPNVGTILRGCGWAEVIDPGVNVAYSPVSSGYESVSTLVNRDGEAQSSAGVRGNGGISFASGQIPKFNFNLLGQYAIPVAASAVVPAPTPNIAPVPVNYVNTTTATIDGVDVALQSLEIDFGTPPTHLNLPNFNEVLLTDREMTGTIVIIAPEIGDLDVVGLVESHSGVSSYAMSIVHGASPSQIALAAPAVQFHTITEVDIEGEQGYSIDFVLLPDSADDELVITFQ